MVARSSAEAEYMAMAHTSCELMRVKHFLEELRFEVLPMDMHYENQVAIHITSNHVFMRRLAFVSVLNKELLLLRLCPPAHNF